jgi:hypothetical protein
MNWQLLSIEETFLTIIIQLHYELLHGTKFPVSLPLQINLYPKQHLTDWLDSHVICYILRRLHVSLLHKIKWLTRKGNLAFWMCFVITIVGSSLPFFNPFNSSVPKPTCARSVSLFYENFKSWKTVLLTVNMLHLSWIFSGTSQIILFL